MSQTLDTQTPHAPADGPASDTPARASASIEPRPDAAHYQPKPPGPVRPAPASKVRRTRQRTRLGDAAFDLGKRAVRRLLRPALAPLEDAIVGAGGWHAWRGGLEGTLSNAIADAHIERRLRDELAYWVRAVHVPGAHEAIDPAFGDFHQVFGQWQRERCAVLTHWLGISDAEAWRSGTAVVEVGGGPHPMVAQGRWRLAVAVDPLSDGYANCGLFPPGPIGFTPVAASGEMLPLTGGTFDLAVCDNCLDHVADPGRVVAELARVLRIGGHAWILVDLRSTVDDMHPHAFTPELLREMLTSKGFHIEREQIERHASHPLAHGEIRLLARKTATPGH